MDTYDLKASPLPAMTLSLIVAATVYFVAFFPLFVHQCDALNVDWTDYLLRPRLGEAAEFYYKSKGTVSPDTRERLQLLLFYGAVLCAFVYLALGMLFTLRNIKAVLAFFADTCTFLIAFMITFAVLRSLGYEQSKPPGNTDFTVLLFFLLPVFYMVQSLKVAFTFKSLITNHFHLLIDGLFALLVAWALSKLYAIKAADLATAPIFLLCLFVVGLIVEFTILRAFISLFCSLIRFEELASDIRPGPEEELTIAQFARFSRIAISRIAREFVSAFFGSPTREFERHFNRIALAEDVSTQMRLNLLVNARLLGILLVFWLAWPFFLYGVVYVLFSKSA